MKSILMSIRPQWCEKIISGEKTIEVRKTAPKQVPFKVLMYVTNGGGTLTKFENCYHYSPKREIWDYESNAIDVLNGKVIGEFVCNTVENIPVDSEAFAAISKPACLIIDELLEYCSGSDMYGLHISDLKIYDKPKEIGEFYRCSDGKCQSYNCKSKYCGIVIECGNLEQLTRPPQNYIKIMEV